MVKENIIIETLKSEHLKGYASFRLLNCIVNTVNFAGNFNLNTEMIFKNCVIHDFQIHACWFTNGLILKNCIVTRYVDYQMGGHNKKRILIEGNIFTGFVNFFDCQFEETIEVKNNIFIKGSNLFGNLHEGFQNTFDNGVLDENNIGDIDLDGLGL